MRVIVLDGGEMASREMAHQALQQGLVLPEYYGKNLDALYDCLTEIGQETLLEVKHADKLLEALGAYGGLLVRVMEEAGRANPALTVRVSG